MSKINKLLAGLSTSSIALFAANALIEHNIDRTIKWFVKQGPIFSEDKRKGEPGLAPRFFQLIGRLCISCCG